MGEVIQLPSRAADYAVASHGTGTQRAYMTAWRQWCDWCAERDTHPLQAAEEVYCDWLASRADAGAATGSLRVVAGAAAAAGLPGNWSSHSLRAGMITDAARLGSSLESIARHARHKRLDTTAGYIRPETAWVGNVTVAVFEAG